MTFFRSRRKKLDVPSRRKWLLAISGFGLCGVFAKVSAQYSDRSAPNQSMHSEDSKAFIKRAFEMRNRAQKLGDQAYGAVVVRNGKIIGESESRVVLDQDPTGHAEMSALRDAAKKHGSGALYGATLYSSSPPCSMCQAAAEWAGISKMIYGYDATDGGAPRSCG